MRRRYRRGGEADLLSRLGDKDARRARKPEKRDASREVQENNGRERGRPLVHDHILSRDWEKIESKNFAKRAESDQADLTRLESRTAGTPTHAGGQCRRGFCPSNSTRPTATPHERIFTSASKTRRRRSLRTYKTAVAGYNGRKTLRASSFKLKSGISLALIPLREGKGNDRNVKNTIRGTSKVK